MYIYNTCMHACLPTCLPTYLPSFLLKNASLTDRLTD